MRGRALLIGVGRLLATVLWAVACPAVWAEDVELADRNIGFAVPAGWTRRAEPQEGAVLDVASADGDERIYLSADHWPGLDVDDVINRIRLSQAEPFSVRGQEPATLAGLPAQRITALQRHDDKWIRQWIYVLLHGEGVYTLNVLVGHRDPARAEALLDEAVAGFRLLDTQAAPHLPDTDKTEVDRLAVEGAGFDLALGGGWWMGPGVDDGGAGEQVLAYAQHRSGPWVAVYGFCAAQALEPEVAWAALLACIDLTPDASELSLIDTSATTYEAHYTVDADHGGTLDGQAYAVIDDRCAWLLDLWGGSPADLQAHLQTLKPAFQVNAAAVRADGPLLQTSGDYLNEAGLYLYDRGRYASAADRFIDAYRRDPQRTYLTNALGSLNRSEQYARARELLDTGSIAEDDSTLLSWSAWIDHHRGARAAAIETYGRLFAIDDYRNDEDLTAYIEALAAAGRFDEAHAAYLDNHDEPPSDALREAMIDLYLQQGDEAGAMAAVDAYVDSASFDLSREFTRLSTLDRLGRYEAVAGRARELIDAGHAGAGTYYWLGVALAKLDRYADALEAIDAALDYTPADAKLLDYRLYLSSELGTGAHLSERDHIPMVEPPPSVLAEATAETPETWPDEADAVYRYRIVSHDYRPDAYRRYSEHTRVRLLNAAAVKAFGSIEYRYDPTLFRAYVNRVAVWDGDRLIANGRIGEVYFADNPDSDQADFQRTLYIPVPGLRPGLELEYVVTLEALAQPGSFPLRRFFLSEWRPVNYAAVTLAGADETIARKAFGVDERVVDGARVWSVRWPAVMEDEPYQERFDRFLPWVAFGKTEADWAQVAHDYLAMVDDKLGRDDEVQGLVREVATEPGRATDALVMALQRNVTYKAIEFGSRGLIPQTPAETLDRRYGDCKDHSLLLQTALHAAGVPAVLALIDTQDTLDPELPSLSQFNHMVVYLPEEGRFIDPTDKYLDPAISPPDGLAGQYALLLDPQAPALVRVGDYVEEHSVIRSERTLSLDETSTIRLAEVLTYSGYPAASMRASLSDIEPGRMADALQDWIASSLGRVRVNRHAVHNLDDPKAPLVVEIDYAVVGQKPIVTRDGLSFHLRGIAEPNYLDLPADSKRISPLWVSHPTVLESVTRIVPPAGLSVAVPEARSQQTEFGGWTQAFTRQGRDLVMNLRYAHHAGRYEPARIAGLQALFDSALEAGATQIDLVRSP